jgi:hypothetical protein
MFNNNLINYNISIPPLSLPSSDILSSVPPLLNTNIYSQTLDILTSDIVTSEILPSNILPSNLLSLDILTSDVVTSEILPSNILPSNLLSLDVLTSDVLPPLPPLINSDSINNNIYLQHIINKNFKEKFNDMMELFNSDICYKLTTDGYMKLSLYIEEMILNDSDFLSYTLENCNKSFLITYNKKIINKEKIFINFNNDFQDFAIAWMFYQYH